MISLTQFINEAKETALDVFKNVICANPDIHRAGTDNIDDIDVKMEFERALKLTKVRGEVRKRNIRVKHADLSMGEDSWARNNGIAEDDLCIVMGHQKGDKDFYGDYGSLKLYWDNKQAAEAISSGKPVEFTFVRGTMSDESFSNWEKTFNSFKSNDEYKASLPNKQQKYAWGWQIAHDNLVWSDADYNTFNKLIADLTGTDPKINEKTPRVEKIFIKF